MIFLDYLEIYELKKSITKKEEVEKLVQLFPIDNCKSYPVSRCIPLYHDCVVFYKGSIPIFAFKICFGCFDVVSTKENPSAKCLANQEPMDKIMQEWIRMGLIDLYLRESK